MSLLLLFLLAFTPPRYWPGVEGGWDVEPVYNRRIPVIDTIGVKDRRAVIEWNRCGARIHLRAGSDLEPFTNKTITIVTGELNDYPRGGWVETEAGGYGVLLLPPGSWERSIPVMRHEFGHALGFGHTGKWSIMGGSNHVQPIDCRGLRRYYG